MPGDLSDDLRAALDASWDAGGDDAGTSTPADTGTASAGATDAGQADAGAAARSRDASGRFASGTEAATDGATAGPDLDAAPDGYNADLWRQLSPEARAATAEYAGKQRQTVADRDASLAGYAPIDAVLSKRRDALTAQYGGVDRALEQLFHLSDWAGRDFQGFVQHLAQQRGISLSSLVPAQQQHDQAQQRQQPDMRQLVAQVVQEQVMTDQVSRDFESFEADATLEFRKDPGIRQTMTVLLQGNIAHDYRQAYTMAAQAHPEIGPKLRTAEAAAAAKADPARVAQAASAKASAAVSIAGAPGTARAASRGAANESIRAGLEAAWGSQGGRA